MCTHKPKSIWLKAKAVKKIKWILVQLVLHYTPYPPEIDMLVYNCYGLQEVSLTLIPSTPATFSSSDTFPPIRIPFQSILTPLIDSKYTVRSSESLPVSQWTSWDSFRKKRKRAQCMKSVQYCIWVLCVRDRCATCAWCGAILCNPGHLLHLGKLFPPTRLSVGSSHSRLPYSSSPGPNGPWDEPPTVQNVSDSNSVSSVWVRMLGRVWKEVSSWRIWLYMEHGMCVWVFVCHSVLFQLMALPQSKIKLFA